MTSALRSEAPAIEVEGLSKRFSGLLAVNEASFSVGAGAITAIIGPNGAGKSTALNVICGFLKPDSGTVRLHGQDVTGRRPHQLAALGLIRTFQISREFGGLTVLENLLVAENAGRRGGMVEAILRQRKARASEQDRLERACSLLDDYGLGSQRNLYARELSGGQKRLLELARAVMARPRILVLDEPMAGVNPALVETLCGHIEAICAGGVTVVMVEHNLNVVESLCEEVIVLAEGHTLASGSMADLREDVQVVAAYLGGIVDSAAG